MSVRKGIWILSLILAFSSHVTIAQSDSAAINPRSFMNALTDGEMYTIRYHVHGCFNSSSDSMCIKKEDGYYYASHNSGAFKMLDKNEISAIHKFEVELQLPRKGGCTTVQKYTIQTKNETATFTDASCRWGGWGDLKKALGWT